tara:strand:- start:143 stop:1222 length:1080 start_codon:yes stop_codon:yes gene_type:complete
MAVSRINEAGLNVNQYGNRNVIINGAMKVAQRGTSVTGITSSGYNTVDRWRVSNGSAGTWTMAQTDVTDLPGFRYSLKMDCTTADASLAATDDLAIQQRIEGQDLQQFQKGTSSAKEWTMSFYVKGTTIGTYICQLFDNNNNRFVSKSYTIDTANTWEYKTITFPADTTGSLNNNNLNCFIIYWYLAAGSDFTSGTLQTTWDGITNANKAVGQVNLAASTSNDWQITGVQLEVGDTATDFEHRTFADELARCQRYCIVLTGTAYQAYGYVGFNESTTTSKLIYNMPTTMRAAPTGSTSGSFSLDGATTNPTTSGTFASFSNSTHISRMEATVSSATKGEGVLIINNNDADATITLDAEL